MTTEQVKCIVCKKEYSRRLKLRRGRKRLGAKKINERSKHTVTCSKRCSKIYRNIGYKKRKQ